MFAEALQSARRRLCSTDTVVTHRDGHRTIEREGETVDTLPPPDVLPPALQQQQPERKRLCIVPPSAPTWTLPSFDGFALPPPPNVAALRVLTWNVWFAPQDADERMAALFSEALRAAPDVLCLQEVVPELAASVRACSALRKAYAISPNDVGAYGCLLLVRGGLHATFREVAFPSCMGRSLLVAESRLPRWRGDMAPAVVAVATAHLESLNNPRTRAKQLRVAQEALAAYPHAVLCGDFNFDATQNFGDWREIPPRPPRPERNESSDDEYVGPVKVASTNLENEVLSTVLPDYVDAWAALRPSEPGHTFDGATNPYVPDPDECMRYDRVMVRGLVPTAIEMLGTGVEVATEGTAAEDAPAAGSSGTPVPSDHYGLVCAMSIAAA